MSSDPVFAVTLECGNCGNVWKRELGERMKAVDDTTTPYVMFLNTACEDWQCDDCCERGVACEVCSLVRPVTITDRSPIEA